MKHFVYSFNIILCDRIYRIAVLNITYVKNGEFYIKCHVSKGTYIRSLVRDIGYELGTVATMVELERTSLGKFSLEDTYTLDDIRSGMYSILDIDDIDDIITKKLVIELMGRHCNIILLFFICFWR